jgi:hypothetical protein
MCFLFSSIRATCFHISILTCKYRPLINWGSNYSHINSYPPCRCCWWQGIIKYEFGEIWNVMSVLSHIMIGILVYMLLFMCTYLRTETYRALSGTWAPQSSVLFRTDDTLYQQLWSFNWIPLQNKETSISWVGSLCTTRLWRWHLG